MREKYLDSFEDATKSFSLGFRAGSEISADEITRLRGERDRILGQIEVAMEEVRARSSKRSE